MNPTIVIIVVAVVAGAALGIFLYMRSRQVVEEPLLSFVCPHCKRKLRFRQRQAGHRGACPQCKKDITFPAIPSSQGSRK